MAAAGTAVRFLTKKTEHFERGPCVPNCCAQYLNCCKAFQGFTCSANPGGRVPARERFEQDRAQLSDRRSNEGQALSRRAMREQRLSHAPLGIRVQTREPQWEWRSDFAHSSKSAISLCQHASSMRWVTAGVARLSPGWGQPTGIVEDVRCTDVAACLLPRSRSFPDS